MLNSLSTSALSALLLTISIPSTTAFPLPFQPLARRATVETSTWWTLQSFTRTCDAGNSECNYSFTIATPSDSEPCSITVRGSPANRESYTSIRCGKFTVSSAWSGQFGAGNGFTTLAVTDDESIVFPAYTDKQVVNGVAVSPDQSYAPQDLN